jgi:hypothetical protein
MVEIQIFRPGTIIAGVLLYLEPVIGLNDSEKSGDIRIIHSSKQPGHDHLKDTYTQDDFTSGVTCL